MEGIRLRWLGQRMGLEKMIPKMLHPAIAGKATCAGRSSQIRSMRSSPAIRSMACCARHRLSRAKSTRQRDATQALQGVREERDAADLRGGGDIGEAKRALEGVGASLILPHRLNMLSKTIRLTTLSTIRLCN